MFSMMKGMAGAKSSGWLFLIVVAISALTSVITSHAAHDDFSDRLRSGTLKGQQGNFFAALVDLRAAVNLDPNNAAGWYQLGLVLGQVSDLNNAEAAFRRAIKLQPDHAGAHYSLGLTLIGNPRNKLDWPGAIAEFREALKYKPDYAKALNMLGAGLTATGDIDSAIPQLEHAIRLQPSLPEAHFNLAIALERTDRLEEAVREYRAAVKAKGGYPEATSALGKLLVRMGKAEDAEHELSEALRLNPDLADAHYAMARVLQSLKKAREAGIEFDQAKDLGQREPDAVQSALLSNRGLELAAQGDMAGATDLLRQAILLKPDYGVPHYNLSLILADSGNLRGAEQEVIKAISLLPGEAKPWFDLGRILRKQGNAPGALEAVSWAARLSPSDGAIRVELESLRTASVTKPSASATVVPVRQPRLGALSDTAADHIAFAGELSASGDTLGAVGELLRALALQPNAVDARRQLAASYTRLDNLPRAILEYHKLSWVAPLDSAARLGLGEILFQQGDAEGAVEEFRVALKSRPDSVEARSALDRAMRALPGH